MMLNTVAVLIIMVISSLHEVVKKFLLIMQRCVICCCWTLYSQNRLADRTFYSRLLQLSESSSSNSCVGKYNMLNYYSIGLS